MIDVKLDFLIVGAAKAGTTALYRMLEEHPQIFLPKNKEPKFITSQFLQYPLEGPGDSGVEEIACKTVRALEALYINKKTNQIAGEGSIDNLYYHKESIPLIKQHFGDPKILIMLRNPVGRAYSAYYHLVRDGRESLDFTAALEQENFRRRNNWQFLWSYFISGLYFEQVKSYLDSFTSTKVIIYDDFVSDPEGVMREVYTFLGVDSNYLAATKKKHNVSGVPKNKIYRFLLYPNSNVLKFLKKRFSLLLGEKITANFRGRLKGKMLHKPAMDAGVKKELQLRYKDDIEKLSGLLDKDLSCWL